MNETTTTYSVWDRKGPRFKWNLVLQTNELEHANSVKQFQILRLMNYGQWPTAQVAVSTEQRSPGPKLMTSDDYSKPSNYPMAVIWRKDNDQ